MKILVTGGASGLGRAIVNALKEAKNEDGSWAHRVFSYDKVNGDDALEPEKSFLLGQVDDLDVLINCAGINKNEWFEEVSPFSFGKVMDNNAFSIVSMTQFLLPKLKASKGTVINIVSNAAHIPMTSSLAYNASKAAALMITKQMAHELTPKYGITIFSVSPNKLAGTGMSKEIEANVCKIRGWTPEYAAEYQKKALMHGLETPPESVAEFIAHLINSRDMKYMSGCDIPFGK
jgi:NAD(P)-dependent dehydrogenase (short-subunit alcohol dehydrogenase family)